MSLFSYYVFFCLCVYSTWKQDCPVKVHLIAGKKNLVVKSLILDGHTHECSSQVYSALPTVRRQVLNSGDNKSTAAMLFKAGVKPCKIRVLLRDMGGGVLNARDLQNYR